MSSPGLIQLAAVMVAFMHMVKNNVTSMKAVAELGGTSQAAQALVRKGIHPDVQPLQRQTEARQLC